ncbi:MAG TPA: CPBP family intramembrane glutamic endopeptidase, partial [Elusimicrobiota bacterium]|nr:CPBP family intramembrane glutamic endopeptidase [Elusimicrobiota bacterium]
MRALTYIGLVLSASWIFTAYLFSSPERIRDFGHIMFIPASVALVLRVSQGESWRDLLRPLTRKLNVRAAAFALLYPLAFIAVCAVLAGIFGWAHADYSKLKYLVPRFTLVGFALNVLKMFGEEYGWRGTLLPELRRTRGPFASAAIVGLVWALWHGPVLYGLGRYLKVDHPLGLCLIQMGA